MCVLPSRKRDNFQAKCCSRSAPTAVQFRCSCPPRLAHPAVHRCILLLLSQMLANPKEHVQQVTMLFERLVDTTLGVTKEEMSQPVFAGLECLSYPELHDVRTWLFSSLCVLVSGVEEGGADAVGFLASTALHGLRSC